MNKQILIGLVGEKGSGKTTLASLLSENWTELTFAYPVKKIALAIAAGAVSQFDLHDPIQKELYNEGIGMTNRKLMQIVGDLLREQLPIYFPTIFSPNIDAYSPIVVMARESLRNAKQYGSNIIFTDVRYQDEAKLIRSEGGMLVRIVRPFPMPIGAPDSHSSETHPKEIAVDLEIVNDGSREDMCSKFMKFLT